mgnify:CR=1 FL=1
MASLTVISWRDIPAQVVVRRGRETAKVRLSDRFQEALMMKDMIRALWNRLEAEEREERAAVRAA